MVERLCTFLNSDAGMVLSGLTAITLFIGSMCA